MFDPTRLKWPDPQRHFCIANAWMILWCVDLFEKTYTTIEKLGISVNLLCSAYQNTKIAIERISKHLIEMNRVSTNWRYINNFHQLCWTCVCKKMLNASPPPRP